MINKLSNSIVKQIRNGKLSGSEVINIANTVGLNVEVFTINSLPSKLKRGSYIILLSHTNTGHWTALRVNKHTAAYYDSFGVPPPQEVIDSVGKDRILFFSDDEEQRLNMNYCGQLSILFLLKVPLL